MRNDVKASQRPQPADAAPIGRGRSRRRRAALRGLLAVPLALALIAPGANALAAEATTGYSQTTPPPTTTTVTTTTTTTTAPPTTTTQATKTETTPSGKGGVSPSSTSSTPTSSTPASSVEPSKVSSEPTATTAKASTLPFTGLDLRWVILAGVLFVGLGLSIVVAQRSRRDTGR